MKIVDIQIHRMKRYLKDRHVDIELTESTKEHLAEVGYDQVYGARPLKRAIQQEILNPLATKLLEGSFKSGEVIEVDMDGDKLMFNKKKSTKEKVSASN
jgi:ATP-dependent Clp protease ATP-binding subunit ClpB